MYQKKFSELESIVVNAMEYVTCIKLIQNETDISKIDFNRILTSHQIVAVKVAGSSTSGKPLSREELTKTLRACDVVLELYACQKKILKFVENRMKFVAPNLSALVGTACASQLLTAAGGLDALERMPACNIQVMGSKKMAALGFSKKG
jgi:U4/U6 small nuclear ribonucleoprotein PRP31